MTRPTNEVACDRLNLVQSDEAFAELYVFISLK
jgi:hypothetical protein